MESDGPYEFLPYRTAGKGSLVLGKTLERVTLPNHLSGRIEGKSSLARLGLAVHITAPTIQAGFDGPLYLEMFNAGPFTLKLQPKMEIAQLILEHLGLPSQSGYAGRFQSQA
jgi:dCTP deaminase